ncbi:MAG: 3-phosphoshikimate 1-carboxyvinyltransferase [Bacteroidaceae bacterium]|nr:3-phosphoshikimate 1-carboxyvinyltransferase [Bacteroidaceae bacterium]
MKEAFSITAPKTLQATIDLPASKSISNRALVFRALAKGDSPIENLADCDDTMVIIKAFQEDGELIDIKAAGTAMRFLTAYYSSIPGTHTITGTDRMKQRPISILVDALRELGAQIDYVEQEGYPPLRIIGHQLQSAELTLPGDVSSQYISALLMIGATLPQGLTLQLTNNVTSLPYIDMTLQLMNDFGATASRDNNINPMTISVQAGGYQDIPYIVENDWSAASYWYEMVVLSHDLQAKVTLPHLKETSTQGDSKGAELFKLLGVQTEYTDKGICIYKQGKLPQQLDADLRDMPDLAQTFIVTCCLLGIPFRFTGLHTLRIKETDRISALISELHKLGFILHSEGDGIMLWNGERCEPVDHPIIATYDDHRMAMAFAPASLRFPHITIEHPEVVSKSYPHYWEDLKKVGFRIDQ